MTYREKIKEIRTLKKMSLREFEKITGISHTNIARFEKGYDSKGIAKESIQIDILKQICDKSNYDFKLFLEETGYIEKNKQPLFKIDTEPDNETKELIKIFTNLPISHKLMILGYARGVKNSLDINLLEKLQGS